MASTYASMVATSTSSCTSPRRPRRHLPRPRLREDVEDGNLSRITLRIPEIVKTKAEERAAEAGQSLNTWLVNVVRAATREGAINVDIDLSSLPFFGGGDPFEGGRGRRGSKRMTGWL